MRSFAILLSNKYEKVVSQQHSKQINCNSDCKHVRCSHTDLFTMTADHGHTLDVGAACETVMNLADNTVIQIGIVLVLIAVAVSVGRCSFLTFSLSDAMKHLRVLHGPPSRSVVSTLEHCYLKKLFSSGIIHSKLHHIA